MTKVLLIRIDKIGDLVLSLPADEILDTSFEATWAIPRGLGFIPNHSDPKRTYQEFDKKFSSFFKFLSFVKGLRPKIAVVLHAPWWVSLALWLARVPTRSGVLSQWHSFIFLNKGLRQKRSSKNEHELKYNIDLISYACDVKVTNPNVFLKLNSPGKNTGLNSDYIVVHPGMGGSALNWPADLYVELIQKLCQQGRVVITGTAADQQWLSPIKQKLDEVRNIDWLDQKLSSTQLLDVLKNAKAVVGPSTGVIHLSASLGTPTIGLYSPILVESPARWGPKGKSVRALVPDDSGQKQSDDVMKLLKVEAVLESIKEITK